MTEESWTLYLMRDVNGAPRDVNGAPAASGPRVRCVPPARPSPRLLKIEQRIAKTACYYGQHRDAAPASRLTYAGHATQRPDCYLGARVRIMIVIRQRAVSI